MHRPALNPYIVLFVAVWAISTGAIFARMAQAPPLVIAAYRVGLATLILLPLALVQSREELLQFTVRDLGLAVAAGLFLALHFATWITSLFYTTVANSVVLVNTNPLWVGLLSPLMTKEPVGKATAAGIAVSVVGGVFIGAGDWGLGSRALRGDLLALAGGICAAFYLLLGRNLRRKFSLVAYIFVCYGSAALFLWLLVLSMQLPISGFSWQTWGCFGGLALIAQIIGHSSYNWALRWLPASLIAVSLLGEPVVSSVLAYYLFDEGLTWLKLAGGGLILSGIFMAARAEHQSQDHRSSA